MDQAKVDQAKVDPAQDDPAQDEQKGRSDPTQIPDDPEPAGRGTGGGPEPTTDAGTDPHAHHDADPHDLDGGDGMQSHIGPGTMVVGTSPSTIVTDVDVHKVGEIHVDQDPIDLDAEVGLVAPGAQTDRGGVVVGGVQVDGEADLGPIHLEGGATVSHVVEPGVTGVVPNVGGIAVGGTVEIDIDEEALPDAEAPELSTLIGEFGTGAHVSVPEAPSDAPTVATSFIASGGYGSGSPGGTSEPPLPDVPDAPTPDEVVDVVDDVVDQAASDAEETGDQLQEEGEEAAGHVEDAFDDLF